MKIKTIVLCSSASFYKKLFPIKKTLEEKDYKVLLPKTAYVMKRTNNFDLSFYKTWHKNPKDFKKKRALMDGHFEKIVKGDGILVANFEKKGVEGYIGGNVLMEIALAYYLKKPIFILFDIDEKSPFKEEVYGINPVFLKGDIDKILL